MRMAFRPFVFSLSSPAGGEGWGEEAYGEKLGITVLGEFGRSGPEVNGLRSAFTPSWIWYTHGGVNDSSRHLGTV